MRGMQAPQNPTSDYTLNASAASALALPVIVEALRHHGFKLTSKPIERPVRMRAGGGPVSLFISNVTGGGFGFLGDYDGPEFINAELGVVDDQELKCTLSLTHMRPAGYIPNGDEPSAWTEGVEAAVDLLRERGIKAELTVAGSDMEPSSAS